MSEALFPSRVLPLIFLVCGIALLIAAARHALRTRAFLNVALEAVGEVVALEEEPAMEPGEPRSYRPVVSFSIGPKGRVRFKSMAHSYPPQYEVGASVRVLYHPNRPHDARIRSFIDLWLLSLILGGLGVVFTALGAGLLLGSGA
jgi:hypothetical protein